MFLLQMSSAPTYMKGDNKKNWFTVYVGGMWNGKVKTTTTLFTVYAGDSMY